MPKKLDPLTIKAITKWFKVYGFTKEGIRIWFERYALKEKIPNLENPGALGSFTLYQARNLTYAQLPTKPKIRYVSKELERLAKIHVGDDLAWLTGTDRFSQ